MYIISKAIKDKEYLYSKKFTILCNSEKQSINLAEYLNKNNDKSIGCFKLKENEVWHNYEIDQYDAPPMYKIKTTNNKISIIVL